MIVWLSGPTGAGKTTFSGCFGQFGYAIVEEKIPSAEFQRFLTHPRDNCARLQETIMRSRYRAWLRRSKSSHIVFDRSIDEDAAIFCRLHFEHGLLNRREYDRLKRLSRDLQKSMPKPDLILFLTPGLDVLSSRLSSATHPKSIRSSLRQQVHLYNDWICRRRESVIKVDDSACKVDSLRKVFRRA